MEHGGITSLRDSDIRYACEFSTAYPVRTLQLQPIACKHVSYIY